MDFQDWQAADLETSAAPFGPQRMLDVFIDEVAALPHFQWPAVLTAAQQRLQNCEFNALQARVDALKAAASAASDKMGAKRLADLSRTVAEIGARPPAFD